MNKFMVVAIVCIICLLIVIYTQRSPQAKDPKTLKAQLQKAFPQLKVIEKYGTVMICEINHRNEPEELVFIRIDANAKKSIQPFGRRVRLTYSRYPSIREIKQDCMPYLKNYL